MDTRTTDFHFFLKSVSQRFSSIAIFNSEFKCLHIQTPFSNNSVGMMTSPKTLKNFFPWDGSHVVAHNDPLLGCSQSDRIQFIFSADSFHFCIEESFPVRWDFSKNTIKIPPIPVVENNSINIPLIDALTSQGDCPSGVREFFLATLQKIEKFQFDFRNILKGHGNFANKDLHKEYLNSVSNSSLKIIKSKTYISSQLELEFGAQSVLKLKTSTSELGIRIDFQGTTNHAVIQMPDTVTDSLCFNFFADYFQFSDVMNEATFSHFQIAKPTQSFVNSKVFANKIYSDYCGADLINQALLDCWSEKTNLKPYLLLKSYFQLSTVNDSIDFNLGNAKPTGSAGLTYHFEPLLSSRPNPGKTKIPNLAEFKRVGIHVKSSQYQFRSPKAKETNDFQAVLELECLSPVQLSIMNPCFPSRVRTGKLKSILVKPMAAINDEVDVSPFKVKNLVVGDRVQVKSGVLDFASQV